MQNVQVKLEFGHKARMKSKILPDGFTHEWTVFVRGPDGCNIQHFVEKVVFYLHESFPKPRRVIKEPPYQVSESGYAGFLIPVEIYFKQKEEPKKISFNYDLILLMEENQQTTYRLEKVTIQNPSDEFREKLLRGGGVIVGPNGELIKPQSSSSSKPKPLPSTSSSHPTSVPSAPPPPAPDADSGKKVKDASVPKVTESNALFETIDAVMKKPKPLKPSEPPAKVRTDITSSQPGSSSKASSGSNSDATNSRPKNMPIASKPATLSSSSSSLASSLKPSKPSATTASTVQSPIVERASFSLADFVKPSDSGSRDAKSSSPSEEGSVKAASHDSDDRLHKKAKHKKHKHEKHGHKRRLSDSDDDEIVPAKSMKTPGSSSAITSGSISVKEKDEKLVASSIDKEKTTASASLSKPKAVKEEHKSGSSSEKKEKSADINLSTSVNDSKRLVPSTKPEVAAGKDDKVKSLDKYEKSSSKKPEKDIAESKVRRDDNSLPNSLKPPTSEAVRSPSTTPVKDKANSDASKKSSKPTMPSSSNVQVKLDYTEAKAEKQSKAAEEKSSSISLKIKSPEVERERKKSDSLTSVPAVTKPQMSSKSSVPDVKISSSSARPLTLSDDDDEDDKVSTKSDGKCEQRDKPAKLDISLENAARFATMENKEQESDDGEKKKKKKKKHKHKDEARELDEQPRPKIKIVQLEEPVNKDQSRNTPKRAESSTPGHRDVESLHSTVAHLAAELNRNDDSNAADDNKMMWLPGNQLPSSNSGNLMQNIRGVLDSFSDDVLNRPTTTSAALERTWGDALISSTLEQRSSELWNDASRLSRGRLPSSGSNDRNGLSDEEGGTVPLSRQLDLPPWSSAGLQGPPSASLRQDPFSPPPLALNGMFLSHSLGSDADDSDDFDGLAPNGERFSALVELQRAIMMTNDRSLLLKVIDLIKRTGLYSVSNGHMFDFDLCKLDVNTVNVLRNFIRSA